MPAPLSVRLRAAAPSLGLGLFLGLVALIHAGLAAHPVAWIGGGDEPKYLALARSAPAHRLYDDHLYAMHPPLHAWLIRLVSLSGASLPGAGAALAGLCTVAVSLLVAIGAARLTRSRAAGLGAGLVVACSRLAAFTAAGAYREPVAVALLLGLLLTLWAPAPGRARVVGAALLGAALGLTWDPFLLLLGPLLLGALLPGAPPGWPRRALLAAALGLLVAWGGWALVRRHALTSEPDYPAGIDGAPEDTAHLGLAAAWNPNFLPATARHNAYHWQLAPAPLPALEAMAPAWPPPDGPTLDLVGTAPPLARRLGGLLLGLAALLGGFAHLRQPAPAPGMRRALALAALGLSLLAAPGLLGFQVRYAWPLLPLIATATACGLAWLEARSGRPRLVLGLVAALGATSALAWAATHPWLSWPRPRACEAHGVAAWIGTRATGGAVAAPVGLTPDLCWLLPGRRVVTLPTDGRGLRERLAARDVRLVVLPHELQPWIRPGASPAEVEEATGLAALRAAHALVGAGVGAGALVRVGVVLEAELTDRPRARALDLLAPPGAWKPARPDEVWLAPGAAAPLLALLERGELTPETVRLLRLTRPALTARLADPREGPAARALLARLD